MSYLVLARKWRPQTFSEVVGQDHVILTLRKAVEKDRLAHAYLFSGPRGCGKTTTARLLAKVINCENRRGVEPCNECSSCKSIIEGRHLDVIEIDGASNRGIDEIRDLREKIGYAPAQSGSKIYIIDEVHMLTPQAFNALLKTLEEPPSHVYLVFATTEPHKVPLTILSRCQRFNFKRLEQGEIVSQLERICGMEGIEYDREALALIARRAEGSMRDAQSLLDQSISASEERITLDFVKKVLGLVDSQLIMELLEAIGKRDKKSALEIVDRVVSSGLDLEEFFLAYIEGLRNLLVLSVQDGGSLEWLDLTDSEIEVLREIGKSFRTEDLLFLFRSATRSFREFKGSNQPRYHLEASVAEAASWESAVELSLLLQKLDQLDENRGGREILHRGEVTRSSGSDTSAPRHSARNAESSREGAGFIGEKGDRLVSGARDEEAPAGDDSDKCVPASHSEGAFARIDQATVSPLPDADGVGENVTDELGGKEQWERFLAQIRESKLTLGIWLMSAVVQGVKGNKLVLGFSPQNRFAREMVLEEKNRRYIESHLQRFFGKPLVIETDTSIENRERARSEIVRPTRTPRRDIKELVGDNPVVRRLIEEFDGELYTEGKQQRRDGE